MTDVSRVHNPCRTYQVKNKIMLNDELLQSSTVIHHKGRPHDETKMA